MPDKSTFQSQLEDAEVLEELMDSGAVSEAINEIPGIESTESAFGHVSAIESLERGQTSLDDPSAVEAIVMRHGYPALLVRDGDYEPPKIKVWGRRLDPHRDAIKRAIAAVGRVELRNHQSEWLGTSWLVDEYTLVTNRHVAELFTTGNGNRVTIDAGVGVNVDFREEFQSSESREAKVSEVILIDNKVDLALMRLERSAVDKFGILPMYISEEPNPEFIAVCGYPARDHRNPPRDMARIFRDIYNVKRLAPGRVMDARASSTTFTHNCTTLGGNSGSAVFDVTTGAAIGLHYAGSALDSNRAVNLQWLRQKLVESSVQFRVPDDVPSPSSDDGAGETEARVSFADRDGYQEDFIGSGTPSVPLPGLNAIQAADVTRTKDGEQVLKYRHFSVVMSSRRRLAYYTAANIDGSSLKRPKRVKTFKIDPRLDRDQQADNDLYKHNPLDRGHLIRRLDPCWGTEKEAKQANVDSMFFTNIAPQHKDLNQKLWLDLEDHILDNTDDENARVSVFVGCVFDEDDPPHKATKIKVPMGFWKIVASSSKPSRGRRSRRRQLQAQAFILFQKKLVKSRDLELIFGGVPGVKQITVEELERITGLDFHVLRDADTFGMTPDVREQVITESIRAGDTTSARAAHYKAIETAEDIVFA